MDGVLFETTGTMTGGGSKPRGGKMGTSVRAATVSREAIADAQEKLEEMVEKLDKIRKQKADAVRNYQALGQTIDRLALALKKIQSEVKDCLIS